MTTDKPTVLMQFEHIAVGDGRLFLWRVTGGGAIFFARDAAGNNHPIDLIEGECRKPYHLPGVSVQLLACKPGPHPGSGWVAVVVQTAPAIAATR